MSRLSDIEPEVSIGDVIADIDGEARMAKRLATYTARGKTAPRVVIIPRRMGTHCPTGEPHRLIMTQESTRWYREHSTFGTTFHAQCRRCLEIDTWAYGETKHNDTGGLNHD